MDWCGILGFFGFFLVFPMVFISFCGACFGFFWFFGFPNGFGFSWAVPYDIHLLSPLLSDMHLAMVMLWVADFVYFMGS